MKKFIDFLKLKEDSAYDVGNMAVGDTSLTPSEEQGMGKLFEIMKTSWVKYRSDVKQFLDRMSAKDPDIKAMVDSLDSLTSALGSGARKAEDDVIASYKHEPDLEQPTT